MSGGARERKQTEKGKAYVEAKTSKKTARRAPTDWKGLISTFEKSAVSAPTERSAMGMDIEVPRAAAPKAFEMKAATFEVPKPKDDEMDVLAAQLSKSGIGGRKRKTRRRKSRKSRNNRR